MPRPAPKLDSVSLDRIGQQLRLHYPVETRLPHRLFDLLAQFAAKRGEPAPTQTISRSST